MTLIVSWAGVDQRATSSLYIASDSRITWGNNYFDQGKKVFACKTHPDIFGYCGDVLFPLMILSQIVDSIDAGLLYAPDWDYKQKCRIVRQRLMDSFNKYPTDVANIMKDSVEILHGIRDDRDSSFHCMQLMWKRKDSKWHFKELKIEKYSHEIRATGSGKELFKSIYSNYESKPDFKTSRAVYQTFCDTLDSVIDSQEATIGGAPQLVGLIRKKDSPGRAYGIIHTNQRFFSGMHIDNYPKSGFNNIEWFDDLFQRTDGKTMNIIKGAQRQPHI